LLSNSGSNFVMVKPSTILGNVQVSEIGLKSLSCNLLRWGHFEDRVDNGRLSRQWDISVF
jgi:hypothetical protein